MVQRSSTHIVKSDSLMDLGLGDLYSERAVASGMTTEKADLTFASLPYRIMHEFQIPIYDAIRERDKDFYERLAAAGFELDWGDDDSGLFMKYLRRGSGYYIDVGACDLVADGSIKLAHGQVDRLTEDSVVLADGTELPADVVVYATGYGSMNGWAADLIGQDVADKVGKVWGLGSDTTKDPGPWEGEQRNMWKPTQQENLWFHGGNLHQSRHYSLYLALQLKARARGAADSGLRATGGAPPELSAASTATMAGVDDERSREEQTGPDPHLWLEDITGDDALEWVRGHNEPTVSELAGDRFEQMRSEALEVLDTDARIPYVRRRGEYLYNFWRDAANPRGLWRRTTLASYRSEHAGLGGRHRRRRTGSRGRYELGLGRRRRHRARSQPGADQPVARRVGRRRCPRIRHAHTRIRG